MTGTERNVLLIAYHYPPQKGSSGLLRTLKFSRYLPENGWTPTVLTVHPRAYESSDQSQLAEIPPEVEVIRAFALDTKRHLSIGGRYSRYMALPDRWVSWVLGAVPAGLRAIRRKKISVIFSTYPIATSPLIGYMLRKLTGKPWVLDLRDPITDEDHPFDLLIRKAYRWIEDRAIINATVILFTAPTTRDLCLKKYPTLRPENCFVISNGYDEEDFVGLEGMAQSPGAAGAPLRLIHAGLIYPHERNPRPLFEALSRLKAAGKISADQVRIELRATGNEQEYAAILNQLNIADIVNLLPALPYGDSLRESASAAGLLLLQGPSCNHQIPAKAYEYLRLGRPILALTAQAGDTAKLLRECGGATIVDIENSREIEDAVPRFLDALRSGVHPISDRTLASRYSRRSQAQQLAQALDRAASLAATPPARRSI